MDESTLARGKCRSEALTEEGIEREREDKGREGREGRRVEGGGKRGRQED